MDYILARLSERSTWSGITILLTALGVHFSPQATDAIIAAGLAISGLLGAFLPDRFKK